LCEAALNFIADVHDIIPSSSSTLSQVHHPHYPKFTIHTPMNEKSVEHDPEMDDNVQLPTKPGNTLRITVWGGKQKKSSLLIKATQVSIVFFFFF
jgi:hypothetical protein